MKTNLIYQGDALSVLKTLPDESIDCVMTSPPYWALRDYGTAEWEGGDENCDHKGISLSNNRNFKDEGGRGSNKSSISSGDCKKCGAKRIDKQLGLEPTFQEYINDLCDIFDEVKRVLKKEGTCWVNMGDTYSATRWSDSPSTSGISKKHCDVVVEKKTNLQDKCLIQIPSRFAIEMTNRGWILRNELIWHKRNCMPASVKDRFTVDFEKLFFFSKSKKYYFEQQLEPLLGNPNDVGRHRKWEGKTPYAQSKLSSGGVGYSEGGRNKRAVWSINPKPYKEAHFAVYPEELCITPIKAGCPEGGIVLDPFFGSGTTGRVALDLSREYIGIELNPEYIELAEKRLSQQNLF